MSTSNNLNKQSRHIAEDTINNQQSLNQLGLNELFSVKDKVIIITGGTRGIGLMMASGLVVNGAKVYLCARKQEECERVSRLLTELAQQTGSSGSARGFAADLSTEAECKRFIGLISQQETKVHVLINNAGIAWGANFDEFPEHAWNKVMTLNVATVFHMTRACLPLLENAVQSDDPARVINVGSVAGKIVGEFENTYSYSTSKAAVSHLTKMLAAQLTSRGINVNCLAPGLFPSKMSEALLDVEQTKHLLVSRIPMGRPGNTFEMAGFVIFLCSKASSYLSGATIPYDGGVSLQAKM
eukprot:TRINITY_DN350_c1_g1_i2.p1 TRINITY_DN350_c1_g1~~TRINITY_DN350_c1_g1_i2.p1  ORF type:complete len:298 (+),score=141.94 TRINITY_DN350_c1_g1_i2:63-956(+)